MHKSMMLAKITDVRIVTVQCALQNRKTHTFNHISKLTQDNTRTQDYQVSFN